MGCAQKCEPALRVAGVDSYGLQPPREAMRGSDNTINPALRIARCIQFSGCGGYGAERGVVLGSTASSASAGFNLEGFKLPQWQ